MVTLMIAALLGVIGSGAVAWTARQKMWAAAWAIQLASFAGFWWAAFGVAAGLGLHAGVLERLGFSLVLTAVGTWFTMHDLRRGLAPATDVTYPIHRG